MRRPRMNRRLAVAALSACLLLPAAASAQFAYTNRDVNVRAGPHREFPLVMWIPGGVQVFVNGCVDGWTWCDVSVGEERGWVYADFLSYDFRGQPVTVVSAGPVLGLPLVTFSIGTYWDDYYRYRPWYGNRYYWYNRPPTWWYRPPPPPPPRPIVRPPPPRPPSWHGPPARPPYYGPPGGGRPTSSRPNDYRPPSQPRPPQAQPAPRPTMAQPAPQRPPAAQTQRPPQAMPGAARPPSSQGNASRTVAQSKPDVRPGPPQQQGGKGKGPDGNPGRGPKD